MTHSHGKAIAASNSEKQITNLLSAIIRGELLEWPSVDETIFYKSFLAQAKHHGVEGLICHLLKPTPMWEKIPSQVQDFMVQILRRQAIIEMGRTQDFLELYNILKQANISVVLLKGGSLAHTHYPRPYLRQRCDTDLFITPKDIIKTQEVFHDLGYQSHGPKYKSHQFTYQKKSPSGIFVYYDVHWRLSNISKYARTIDHKEVLREAFTIPALDDCLSLQADKALTLACMHRAGNPFHDPNKLIWLYDIHLLISAMSVLELEKFAKRVVEKNIQDVCLDAFLKTRQCLSTKIPDKILDFMMTPLQKHSIAHVFTNSYLSLIIDDLKCLPNTETRCALIRELLLPSAEEILRKYEKHNPFWLPLLYVRYILHGLLKRLFLH